MRKNVSIWMLGIAAVLASCSSEDALQTDNDNGVVRITAQLADDMKTRAVTEEGVAEENTLIDNFVLEVYTVDAQGIETKDNQLSQTNSSGVFALKLDRHENYRFYCWADEGEESAFDTSSGLANITLKTNRTPTLAHRGQTTDPISGESSGDINIQMTHAVAKVVLKTTSSLSANTVELSTNTYSAYNALKGEVTGDATTMITVADPDEQITVTESAPVEALSFYTLVNEADFPVTINYTTTPGDFSNPYEKVFDHAPFQADYRTVFIGNIAGLRYNDVSVKATLDENWDDDIAFIATNYAGQIAAMPNLIAKAVGTGNALGIVGPMNSEDLTAIADYLKKNSGTTIDLDLSDAGLISIPDLTFGDYFKDKAALSLGQVNLPTTITEIGGNAFRYCPSFTITNWDELTSLTTIGNAAFMGSGLSGDITLPESITTIEGMAFY